jgi:hypothetical protein
MPRDLLILEGGQAITRSRNLLPVMVMRKRVGRGIQCLMGVSAGWGEGKLGCRLR